MLKQFYKVIQLLSRAEKKQGAGVLVLVLLMALMETAGVASVMPFFTVVGQPKLIQETPHLNFLFEHFGFESTRNFMIFLCIASIVVFAVAGVLRIYTFYALNHFAHMRRHSISSLLFYTYLYQPYEFFLKNNTSNLAKSMLSEVDQFTTNVVRPLADTIAFGFTSLVLIVFMFFIDFWIAIGLLGVFGGGYGLIYLIVQRWLLSLGESRLAANRIRFHTAQEGLGGIKELKVLGQEKSFFAQFLAPSRRYSHDQAIAVTLAQVPRFIVEVLVFGGALTLVVILLATRGTLGEVLPLLSAFGFAGYRLLPAAQKTYAGASKLRFGGPALDNLYGEIHGTVAPQSLEPERARELPPALPLARGIGFDEVTYHYPGSTSPTLADVSCTIGRGTTVGVIGPTGAGKTTFVDLLLGLIEPTRGCIRIDDQTLTAERIPQWRRTLGYVPQHIHLADASVAENIAFGLAGSDIDRERVVRAAQQAQIHNFIVTELPHGYDTVIGERGIRLSGGQRQRLGLARALYGDPAVLILDEATSALDEETEKAVMAEIEAVHGDRTIVMIAHRLSTVAICDHVLEFRSGRLAQIHAGATFANRGERAQPSAQN